MRKSIKFNYSILRGTIYFKLWLKLHFNCMNNWCKFQVLVKKVTLTVLKCTCPAAKKQTHVTSLEILYGVPQILIDG